jgi:ABC-2 type transport system permease protein
VPGLLIQLGLFGSTFVGFAIISDWRAGVIERFRVTPVSRLSIMAGRVLRDVVTLVVQAVVLVLVKSEDAFAPLINTVVVPLLLMSGIFLPLTLGPGWLQGIAPGQPVPVRHQRHAPGLRGPILQHDHGGGIAVAVGMAVIFLWLGSRVFLRENA